MREGVELEGLEVRRPTLEDVYLALTERTTMSLFLHELSYEQRLFWRSREAAFFIFLFPLLLFVLAQRVLHRHDRRRAGGRVLLAGLLGYGAANDLRRDRDLRSSCAARTAC